MHIIYMGLDCSVICNLIDNGLNLKKNKNKLFFHKKEITNTMLSKDKLLRHIHAVLQCALIHHIYDITDLCFHLCYTFFYLFIFISFSDIIWF